MTSMQEAQRLHHVAKDLLQKLYQATQHEPLQQQLLTACVVLLHKGDPQSRAALGAMPAVEVCSLLPSQVWVVCLRTL